MKVMLRKSAGGQLVLYIPKKDLEEPVVAMDPGAGGGWGGILTLKNGMRLFVEPLAGEPQLPLTVEARRLDA